MTNLKSTLKSRDITLLTKVCLVKVMVFPIVMYRCELDYKESWAPKNWCFWTVCWRRLDSLLDWKEIKPVSPKGNQSWIFIGRTAAEAETPILWLPDVKRRPWCWERLKAGEEGDDGGWDDWMASLTWMDMSLSKLRELMMEGKPGILQSMGSRRVGHDWVTELKWKWYQSHETRSIYIFVSLHVYMHVFSGVL